MELTHLQQLETMLKSIGYQVEIVSRNNKHEITITSNGENVTGYLGFVADFEFNEDGSLKNIGIYE
jgi:hypothetical protein